MHRDMVRCKADVKLQYIYIVKYALGDDPSKEKVRQMQGGCDIALCKVASVVKVRACGV